MEHRKQPLEVVIVGGSLAGLMCAIPLKHAGHSVTVLERDSDQRESHMSGLGMGTDVQQLLSRYDRLDTPFSHRSKQVQLVRRDGSIKVMLYVRRDMTSWDAFYFRLRSNFDGHASLFYPNPPGLLSTDGRVSYQCNKEVIEVSRVGSGSGGDINGSNGSRMALTVLDRRTQKVSTTEADLVIGADGANSVIRAAYLPDYGRRFVGYVTWRGIVAESKVSEATRETFKHSVTAHLTPGQKQEHKQHCIVYVIPGPGGTLEPGKRWLNCAWYTNETQQSLDEILIDGVDGHRHHNTVPAGRIRPEIWRARVKAARDHSLLPASILEIVEKIERPYLQVITETDPAPKAAFENGRVLLVGEALCQFRPHTSFSAAQGAFDALRVEEYVRGAITLGQFDDRVTRFSRLHWWQAAWFGRFYQGTVVSALAAACQYWWHCAVDRVRAWWTGTEPLLRTSATRVEDLDD